MLPVHVTDEPVAAPRKRLDEARCHRRIAQGFTKPFYRRVQTVLEIHERIFRPELATQIIAGDQRPRLTHH